eukprot:scaffold180106_cov32-Tisochrysis_lutea.AAC.1
MPRHLRSQSSDRLTAYLPWHPSLGIGTCQDSEREPEVLGRDRGVHQLSSPQLLRAIADPVHLALVFLPEVGIHVLVPLHLLARTGCLACARTPHLSGFATYSHPLAAAQLLICEARDSAAPGARSALEKESLAEGLSQDERAGRVANEERLLLNGVD